MARDRREPDALDCGNKGEADHEPKPNSMARPAARDVPRDRLAVLLAGSAQSWAQQAADPAPVAAPTAAAGTSAAADTAETDPAVDLDVLMAPIALYPDPLLVAVLQASVVPVDVIAAAQFLDAYETDKSLQPDPNWDPAVIGLLGFPTVLRAMAANMDWVEDAGDAVLENLAGVQQSVQQDRAEFYAAGVLKSDDKQNVIVEADVIRIEPVDPEVIYLPSMIPRHWSRRFAPAMRAWRHSRRRRAAEEAGTPSGCGSTGRGCGPGRQGRRGGIAAGGDAGAGGGRAVRQLGVAGGADRRGGAATGRGRRSARRRAGAHQLRGGTGGLCRSGHLCRRR